MDNARADICIWPDYVVQRVTAGGFRVKWSSDTDFEANKIEEMLDVRDVLIYMSGAIHLLRLRR